MIDAHAESLLEYALAYAAGGWPVFPVHYPTIDDECSCGDPIAPADKADRIEGLKYCGSPAKHPMTSNGFKSATCDEAQVRRWWKQWPSANIGLPTGEQSFIVIDVDTRHGGDESLAELLRLHGGFDEVISERTGGGGQHLLFAHPGFYVSNNQNGKLGRGIDIRGDGGYIVVAPSRHISGAEYEWVNPPSGHMPELPDWLADMIRPKPVAVVAQPVQAAPPANAEAYVLAALHGEVEAVRGAVEGNRNNQLNESSYKLGTFVGAGVLNEGDAESHLFIAACSNGLGEDEARKTIRSGLAAGRKEPRVIPERKVKSAPKPKAKPRESQARPEIEPPEWPDADEFPQDEIDTEPLESNSPIEWQRTDLGIAEEFLVRYGSRVRRVVDTALQDTQGFVWWTGAYWLTGPQAVGQIYENYHAMVFEVRRSVKEIWDNIPAGTAPTMKQTEFFKFAKSLESSARMKSFLVKLGQIQTETMWLNTEDFDRDTFLLNCKNGTINLQTGELQPHNPDDLLTKCISIEYKKDADQSLWLKFLNRVQSKEQAAFLQRWCGYCATGQTTEKKFLVTLGKTNTGKSVFWGVFRTALGPYARTAAVETFEDVRRNAQAASEDLAVLRGVRLVVLPEPAESYRLSDALIKRATGGEQIRARFLNQGGFEYLPQFKVVYYTNFSLKFNGADSGMQTRYCELSFTEEIPEAEQDKKLTDTLIASHLPGVLAWIVEGATAWKKEKLNPPATVLASTKDRLKDQDPMAQFIEMCFDVAPTYRVKVKDSYDVYLRFCAMAHIRNPVNKIVLGQRLEARGFKSKVEKDKNSWRYGLALKEEFQHRPSDDEPSELEPYNGEW